MAKYTLQQNMVNGSVYLGGNTVSLTALGDYIENCTIGLDDASFAVSGTFVGTVTVTATRTGTATTITTLTAAGKVDFDASIYDTVKVECTAYTSGTISVLGVVKKKDLSVEDITTAPTITGGVVGFEDSKIEFTKSEQGSGYELVKYFIASNLTHFRGFGTTTSTDPVLQASYDGGNTWETCIAAPTNLEAVNSIVETSLGLVATYGSNGNGDGKYAYSTDKGKTWSALQTAYNNSYALTFLTENAGRLYFAAYQNNAYQIDDIVYIAALGGAYTLCTVPTVGDGTKKRRITSLVVEAGTYIAAGYTAPAGTDGLQVWSSADGDGATFVEDSTKTTAFATLASSFLTTRGVSIVDGKYIYQGTTTTGMPARDVFAIVISSWTPFVGELIVKNPSGRANKSTYDLFGVVKSAYSGRYGFAMGGNAGLAQIVYTDRPIAEWGIAPDSDFYVVKPSFAGTVTQVNSIMETATGRCLITTRGGTSDADVWYSDYFFCSYVNRGGKFREVASTGNVVAGDSKGIHTMYRNRLSAPHIGTVPTWSDAVAIFVADPTYPVGTTIEILKAANNTGATIFDATWDGSKLVPKGEVMLYGGSIVTSTLATTTDVVIISFIIPKSIIQNSWRNLYISGVGGFSSSSTGTKLIKLKNGSTVITMRGTGFASAQYFDLEAEVKIAPDYSTACYSGGSFTSPTGPYVVGDRATTTIFQGSESNIQVDIVAFTTVSETLTLNSIKVYLGA